MCWRWAQSILINISNERGLWKLSASVCGDRWAGTVLIFQTCIPSLLSPQGSLQPRSALKGRVHHGKWAWVSACQPHTFVGSAEHQKDRTDTSEIPAVTPITTCFCHRGNQRLALIVSLISLQAEGQLFCLWVSPAPTLSPALHRPAEFPWVLNTGLKTHPSSEHSTARLYTGSNTKTVKSDVQNLMVNIPMLSVCLSVCLPVCLSSRTLTEETLVVPSSLFFCFSPVLSHFFKSVQKYDPCIVTCRANHCKDSFLCSLSVNSKYSACSQWCGDRLPVQAGVDLKLPLWTVKVIL